MDWNAAENDLVVQGYFSMLTDEMAGKPINKAAAYRAFQAATGRSPKSAEWKFRNVSAILAELGMAPITGLTPADNYQDSLVHAVDRYFERPGTVGLLDVEPPKPVLSSIDGLIVGPPLRRQRNEMPSDVMLNVIRKVDPAARDHANRTLGFAGEEFVFELERRRLERDLPKRVSDLKWVARDEGDGHGYDIRSFDDRGHETFIEVKTTAGGARTPFFVTRNERTVSNDLADAYRLYRVFDFRKETRRIFTLKPPLEDHVRLEASVYSASFT